MLAWLLTRLQVKETPVRQNKQYAAEVLAILLQASSANRTRLTDLNGADVLLQLLAAYRKRDPDRGTEEEEYVENVFDCLTCVVDEPVGKARFIEAEGVELCLIMLRQGMMSKARALRLLDHSVAGLQAGEVCERLVEAAGLKTVFGMFMKKVALAPTLADSAHRPGSKISRPSSTCSASLPPSFACFPETRRGESGPSQSSWRRTTRRLPN